MTIKTSLSRVFLFLCKEKETDKKVILSQSFLLGLLGLNPKLAPENHKDEKKDDYRA